MRPKWTVRFGNIAIMELFYECDIFTLFTLFTSLLNNYWAPILYRANDCDIITGIWTNLMSEDHLCNNFSLPNLKLDIPYQTHCGLGMPYGNIDLGQYQVITWWWGNGLLPDTTKPLPEPMLTKHHQFVLWLSPDKIQPAMLLKTIFKINFEIPHLTLEPHCPGANKLSKYFLT